MTERQIKVRSARGVVCTPLDEINRMTSVAPDVWNSTCSRPGSWYKASDKAGLYLVVSAFEIEGLKEKNASVISQSDFRPPRLAKPRDLEALSDDPLVRNKIPPEWLQVEEKIQRIYLRWANRMGSDIDDFQSLLKVQTANHANFIHPRFCINGSNGIVPYSIDRTAHLCSCCLELFQVLGSEFPQKLVAPCPGAAIYARLAPDRYLLVEKPSRPAKTL
jgi:hypothetical protein